MAGSALYTGWVMHRRRKPTHHRFKYGVFSLLLDLDEIPQLARRLRLFNWNGPGLFSFHDRDHGDGRPLGAWLDAVLAEAGIRADGRRQVLCYPRILGYVFNPLSVWFCHDRAGVLQGIVYEVHNTYGERHAYALPCPDGAMARQACDKAFYVSPFLSGDCRYRFRIVPPCARVSVAIEETEHGMPVLSASFRGIRRPLSDRTLLGVFFRYPLMTLKVIVAIHYEAARLILKGVQRHPHSPLLAKE